MIRTGLNGNDAAAAAATEPESLLEVKAGALALSAPELTVPTITKSSVAQAYAAAKKELADSLKKDVNPIYLPAFAKKALLAAVGGGSSLLEVQTSTGAASRASRLAEVGALWAETVHTRHQASDFIHTLAEASAHDDEEEAAEREGLIYHLIGEACAEGSRFF